MINTERAAKVNNKSVDLDLFCRTWEYVSADLLEQAVNRNLHHAVEIEQVVPMLTYMLTYAVKERIMLEEFYEKERKKDKEK